MAAKVPALRNNTAPEQFILILEDIAAGLRPSEIYSNPNRPTREVFWRWVRTSVDNLELLRQARAFATHRLVEDMLDIADNDINDIITTPGGRPMLNPVNVARSKVRIDTRARVAEMWNRQEYGDTARPDENIQVIINKFGNEKNKSS